MKPRCQIAEHAEDGSCSKPAVALVDYSTYDAVREYDVCSYHAYHALLEGRTPTLLTDGSDVTLENFDEVMP